MGEVTFLAEVFNKLSLKMIFRFYPIFYYSRLLELAAVVILRWVR